MSIVSRLTTVVKDEIMSSAARAFNAGAFYDDIVEMRRVDGAYGGLWSKERVPGAYFINSETNDIYVYDGEQWVLTDPASCSIMGVEGP